MGRGGDSSIRAGSNSIFFLFQKSQIINKIFKSK